MRSGKITDVCKYFEDTVIQKIVLDRENDYIFVQHDCYYIDKIDLIELYKEENLVNIKQFAIFDFIIVNNQ